MKLFDLSEICIRGGRLQRRCPNGNLARLQERKTTPKCYQQANWRSMLIKKRANRKAIYHFVTNNGLILGHTMVPMSPTFSLITW